VLQSYPRLLGLVLQANSLKLGSCNLNIIINIKNIIICIINITIDIIINIINITFKSDITTKLKA